MILLDGLSASLRIAKQRIIIKIMRMRSKKDRNNGPRAIKRRLSKKRNEGRQKKPRKVTSKSRRTEKNFRKRIKKRKMKS